MVVLIKTTNNYIVQILMITINGKEKKWYQSIPVVKGEVIHIIADGVIYFSNGMWDRTPDGVDRGGNGIQEPAYKFDGMGGQHIAPFLRKNSLVAKIGINGHPFQVGSDLVMKVEESGDLYFAANDNFFNDNSGYWTVNVLRSAAVTRGKARVYCRPSGAENNGHIGWAFTINDSGHAEEWLVGGTENIHFLSPATNWAEKNCWFKRVANPDQEMTAPCNVSLTQDQIRKLSSQTLPVWEYFNLRYDLYCEFEVENPQIDAAKKQYNLTSKEDYNVVTRNCMHDTYNILHAYGVRFSIKPMQDILPVNWFNDISRSTKVFALTYPVTKPVDLTIYKDQSMRNERFSIYTANNWDLNLWNDTVSSLILRKGFLCLYKGAKCTGEHVFLQAPMVISNLKSFTINGAQYNYDNSIKSLIISEHPFNPTIGAPMNTIFMTNPTTM